MTPITYVDCWIQAATALFAQALAGPPELSDALPKPLENGAVCFAAQIAGDVEGRFSVMLDAALLETALLGEGVDARTAWRELLREVADAAVGDLLAKAGLKCRIVTFEESAAEPQVTRAFQLRSSEHAWTILVRDDLHAPAVPQAPAATPAGDPASVPLDRPGIHLLLDVELEATLRFGCRELELAEILSLGPGDVVQLDRHISDPVDLIVGDKIVAQGEVVLVNGNFGLRVTEVAAPRERLEGIRCLF